MLKNKVKHLKCDSEIFHFPCVSWYTMKTVFHIKIYMYINCNLFVDESFTVYPKCNLVKSLHMVCKNNGTWNVCSVYYVCNSPHESNSRHISFLWHICLHMTSIHVFRNTCFDCISVLTS